MWLCEVCCTTGLWNGSVAREASARSSVQAGQWPSLGSVWVGLAFLLGGPCCKLGREEPNRSR